MDSIAEAFTTITLTVTGNATIGGDLTVDGTFSATGFSSSGEVEAPYFTATSTSQASTFPYASSTAITVSGTASTTDLIAETATIGDISIETIGVSSTLTVGSLNGPLQANAGVVSATTSIQAIYGGTGQTSYTTGDLLYASNATTLTKLGIGSAGEVLKVLGGVPSWEPDSVGGGGSGAWATTSDSLAVYPDDTSDVVIVGGSATSTTGNILEVIGNALFRNQVSTYGTTTGLIFTATSSVATSTFPNAEITRLALGGDVVTDLSGTGLSVTAGALSLTNTSVSYGGVSVALGGSDATPAFNLVDASGLPVSTGIAGLGTGVATLLGTPSSANLAAALTDETGSGAAVFGTNPTLSGVTLSGNTSLTNATSTTFFSGALTGTSLAVGGSASTTISSTGAVTTPTTLTVSSGGLTVTGNSTIVGTLSSLTGVTSSGTITFSGLTADRTVFTTTGGELTTTAASAALSNSISDETGSGSLVFATSPTLVTPNLGTPSALTLTNATGLPVSTGISGLGTGVATFLATPSTANLASAVTGETGSGALVFGTSPTLSGTTLSGNTSLANATSTTLFSGTLTGNLFSIGGSASTTIATTGAITTPTTLTVSSGGLAATGNSTIVGTLGSLTGLTSSGTITFSGLTSARAVCTTTGGALTVTCASADLAASLSDETGTGSVVFSASPTFTGTISAAAATLSSSFTLSGSAANILLGSNFLSGDGGDEGISVDSSGTVTTSGTFQVGSAGATLSVVGGGNFNFDGGLLFGDNAGNLVGIGVTDPDTKLEIFNTVGASQLKVSYDATRYAQFQSTSVGDLVIDAQGGDVSLLDENLFVCTGGSCPTGTPSGNGNVIAETAIGIASSTPWAGLGVASGKAIVVGENTLATSTSMTIDWRNGNQQLVRLGTAATTISFSGYVEGQKLALTVCNPNATAGAISWGTQILWPSASAPTQTTTANKCDVWSFLATVATSTLKIFGSQNANF
ncbi:hypothetical protein K2Y00_01350 [Patescibacteria group bacterium]|nr:hypothetical protein [Patescibacteria group bacterium]